LWICRDLTEERINPVPEATELLHSNLHEVFSERNPERRQAAIERTYTEDVTFIDPEGEVAGRQALSDKAQKLLDGIPAGSVLEEDGPRYVGTDTAALAWRLGPPGKPIARGVDILTIRDGRVSVVRTLIAPESDA
jgi:SnoaL-like domain